MGKWKAAFAWLIRCFCFSPPMAVIHSLKRGRGIRLPIRPADCVKMGAILDWARLVQSSLTFEMDWTWLSSCGSLSLLSFAWCFVSFFHEFEICRSKSPSCFYQSLISISTISSCPETTVTIRETHFVWVHRGKISGTSCRSDRTAWNASFPTMIWSFPGRPRARWVFSFSESVDGKYFERCNVCIPGNRRWLV